MQTKREAEQTNATAKQQTAPVDPAAIPQPQSDGWQTLYRLLRENQQMPRNRLFSSRQRTERTNQDQD